MGKERERAQALSLSVFHQSFSFSFFALSFSGAGLSFPEAGAAGGSCFSMKIFAMRLSSTVPTVSVSGGICTLGCSPYVGMRPRRSIMKPAIVS